MIHSNNLSNHLKQIFFGGNWTSVNVRDTINPITLKQANHKIENLNTIADLVFHINYYIEGVLPVFDGGALEIRDEFSYHTPIFNSETDWQDFKSKVLTNAETLVNKVACIKEKTVFEPFVEQKYGSYYSNIHGIIEHTHYHLGQIVILKKLSE